LITSAFEDGIIAIPPPILSRVYQTISRGYVNLLNTKKITDTKFPFPYVQLITALLFLHMVLTPLVISATIPHFIWGPMMAFVPTFGAHALNFIAIELEDPFGEDDNDLPLHHFQAEMNNCLLMLLHPNTDIIAGISEKCITDFDELKSTLPFCPDSVIEEETTEPDVGTQKRRPSLQLFNPDFKLIGSSKSSLETVVTSMEASEARAAAAAVAAKEVSEEEPPFVATASERHATGSCCPVLSFRT